MFKQIVPLFCAVSILTGCIGSSKKSTMKDDTELQNDEIVADANNNNIYMLIGTYTGGDSKGIYVYSLDTITGVSSYVSEIEIDNPSYLVLDETEKYVYAVSENDDINTAAANAFSFDKEKGTLTFINKRLTGGGAPCHINIDHSGKHVIVSNYLGGSLSVFNTTADGGLDVNSRSISFMGKGLDPVRQEKSHIHFSTFTPDKKYLLVDDLGTDKIHKFNVNENDSSYISIGTPASFSVEAGLGPRHLEFHPNGKYAYLITELGGDVLAFDYNEGNLHLKQTIKADTLNARGSADIHISPDGKFVYASNRLKGDGIAIFAVKENDGTLTKVGYQATEKHPRNFAITPNGKFLLVANRDSDVIQVFQRNPNTGLLEDMQQNIKVGMPVCIKFASKN